MKKIFLSVAAVAALTAAAPANAQSYGRDYDRYERGHERYDRYDRTNRSGYVSSRGFVQSVRARAAAFENRVQQALYSGRIDKPLASSIIGQLNATVKLASTYQRGGLAESEVAAIDQRFQTMEQRLRYDDRRRGRDYGYRW